MSTWCQFSGGGEVRATAVQLRQSLNQLLALACLELVQVSGELIGRRKDRLDSQLVRACVQGEAE